jgi:Ca-activated chloride channel family protein
MLTDMLAEDEESRKNTNRILFLTDALPNVGGSEKCLIDLSKRAAESSSIYITYIGVGLNFNSDLIYELTKIRASNYFSVHSKESFRRILPTDFNYIVTPIAFNIQINMKSKKSSVYLKQKIL